MYKYLFYNDYSELAHADVIAAFARQDLKQLKGYSEDDISRETQEILRHVLERSDADIHFVSSGTLTNLISLDWMLKSTGSVIAADTGHINVHEAGAIEATGHKINTVPHQDGKLDIPLMEELLDIHTHEHMVTPGVVYLSQSTELGTVYSKQEFELIAEFCARHELFLYVDGARMGMACASKNGDLKISEIAEHADMLYVGGTKCGAMFGEAVVVLNDVLKKNFRGAIKQRGGLLAKGFSISLQFRELFREGLYFNLASNANEKAQMLSSGISGLGFPLLIPTQTNQVFPILPNDLIDKLQNDYGFYTWSKMDQYKSAVRLVTSWATPEESVEQFLGDLRQLIPEN